MDEAAARQTVSAAAFRRAMAAVLLAVLGLCATPLAAAPAVVPEAAPQTPQPQAEASPVPGQTIGDTSEDGADERIARRIEGIFAAVPALQRVTVSVRQGVVMLDGTVATPEDIGRAGQIASRIVGVVTVENNVERRVSVEESVQSLGGFSGKLAAFVKMLPLTGAALAVAVLIALLGYALAASTWIWRRLAPNSFLTELIASAIRFIFVTGGIVIALQMVGAGGLLGAVLGGAGIVGIALGFAMRDTIENYVASVMLSVRQPFRANDWIVIGEYEGRVIRLTSRATILMTLDGNHLRIPNATVFKAVILNYTRNPQRRFDFDLGINADADPTVARHLGTDALAKLEFVLKDPPPSARIEQVGDSNILIRFLGWIDQTETDWYKARSRAIPAVKAALEQAGFALPEPIYRLRFDQNMPLPLRNVTGETRLPEAAHPAAPAQAAAPEHVTPDEVIAGMVEKERRQGPEADNDLLDPRRPVE